MSSAGAQGKETPPGGSSRIATGTCSPSTGGLWARAAATGIRTSSAIAWNVSGEVVVCSVSGRGGDESDATSRLPEHIDPIQQAQEVEPGAGP